MQPPTSAHDSSFDYNRWQTGGGKGTPLPFDQTCFSQYWKDLPSIIHDTSSESDGKNTEILKVNGHSFRSRMAAYKYLIENTGCHEANADVGGRKRGEIMAKLWGPNHERHFLWGYGALLDWQARSGRLSIGRERGGGTSRIGGGAIDEIAPDDVISTKSWWGYMNFCVSVCILLGAVEAGVLEHDCVVLDSQSSELMATDPVVRDCVEWWAKFWRDDFTEFSCKTLAVDEGTRWAERAIDRLYDELNKKEWEAHCRVFDVAVFTKDGDGKSGERSKELLSMLPEPEQNFAVGFSRLVDVLAALNIWTDLVTTSENGVGFLPLHVVDEHTMVELKEEGRYSTATPIEKKRQKMVLNMHKMCGADDRALGAMALFWRRAGRWRTLRSGIAGTLDTLTHGETFAKGKEIMKVLFFFALPGSATEVAVWGAVSAAAALSLAPLLMALRSRRGRE